MVCWTAVGGGEGEPGEPVLEEGFGGGEAGGDYSGGHFCYGPDAGADVVDLNGAD